MMDTVRVTKFNEVHNRIECDPGIAMEIATYYTFDVPGAKFSPMYKNKIWDGKIRTFNPMNRLLYCGLNDNLKQFCEARDYDFVLDDGFEDTEFSVHEAVQFVDKLKPKHTPRDYQMAGFVHAVRKNRSLLLSPTGSGKSLLIYMLSCYYRLKTLIIVPSTSLVHQMTSDFEDYGLPQGMVHKIMSGQEKDSDKIFFCSTWQSIYKMPKQWFQQFGLVIVDEAHLAKAKSITTIMNNMTNCKYRFGFTGTLDGVNVNKIVLEGLFGPVKRITSTAELMEQKHLAELEIKSLILKYPDEVRKIVSGYDYHAEMDFLTQNPHRNKFIKNLALSLKGNTIIFYQFVEKHGKILHELISKEATNRSVYFISGDVDGAERDQIRKIVETEQDAIIVASYGTSSTGINLKNLSNMIFASPSKSIVRNLQSIGRGLRTTETKTNATLYDIADDLSWKSKKNFTLLHYLERIKIYSSESFQFKTYQINLTN
jgi:superfamily II DNA or RNA helicase